MTGYDCISRIGGMVAIFIIAPAAAVPFHVYLTWQGNTGTTMTVNYHTPGDTAVSEVRFDRVSHGGDVGSYRSTATGNSFRIPGLDGFSDRTVHAVELRGLQPGSEYFYVAGDSLNGYTAERSFRTIPATGPIRFVTGGDMGTSTRARELLAVAASHDPMFALIGGDVAYADGALRNVADWDTWFTNWEELMVGPRGHTIPIVIAIGNHETDGSWGQFSDPYAAAPFYFGYFAQDGAGFEAGRKAYFSRTFGNNVVIHVLDSGHVTSYPEQAQWLDRQMGSYPPLWLQFAVYHVPLYPSHREFLDARNAIGREFWLPVFDRHGLIAAFENHDHTMKRTKPLRDNMPAPDGTVYLGDGCFGQFNRAGDQAQRLEDPANFPNELSDLGLSESYLETWASVRHFWMVEVEPEVAGEATTITVTAYSGSGAVLDQDTRSVKNFEKLPALSGQTLVILATLLTVAALASCRMSERGLPVPRARRAKGHAETYSDSRRDM